MNIRIISPYTYKLALVALLLLCFNTESIGQSRLYRPDWSIKYNPLAIIAYTPGIELGVERSLTANTTIHLGASYLSDFGIFRGRNFEGYKLIADYRFYNLFRAIAKNGYTALQFNFKKAYSSGSTYVDRANGSYQQLYDIRANNTSIDFLLASGIVLPMGQRFSLDLSLVYGAKRLSLDVDDLAEDAIFNAFNEDFFDFTLNQVGSQWFAVFRMQAKLNFEFNQKNE
ncbi:MAG: DUF3575 domain-containing protein [Bacteroidota bacterium]